MRTAKPSPEEVLVARRPDGAILAVSGWTFRQSDREWTHFISEHEVLEVFTRGQGSAPAMELDRYEVEQDSGDWIVYDTTRRTEGDLAIVATFNAVDESAKAFALSHADFLNKYRDHLVVKS